MSRRQGEGLADIVNGTHFAISQAVNIIPLPLIVHTNLAMIVIIVRAKPRHYVHTRNFYNQVLEKMLNLVRAKPKLLD